MVFDGETACEPETALLPDQPPDATQELAFEDDQLNTAELPTEIDVGLATKLTVGAGVLNTLTDALSDDWPRELKQVMT